MIENQLERYNLTFKPWRYDNGSTVSAPAIETHLDDFLSYSSQFGINCNVACKLIAAAQFVDEFPDEIPVNQKTIQRNMNRVVGWGNYVVLFAFYPEFNGIEFMVLDIKHDLYSKLFAE